MSALLEWLECVCLHLYFISGYSFPHITLPVVSHSYLLTPLFVQPIWMYVSSPSVFFHLSPRCLCLMREQTENLLPANLFIPPSLSLPPSCSGISVRWIETHSEVTWCSLLNWKLAPWPSVWTTKRYCTIKMLCVCAFVHLTCFILILVSDRLCLWLC